MRSSIKLGTLFGVPLGLNYSWFFIFAFITYSMGSVYGDAFPALHNGWRWGLALGTSLLFFASLLSHEMAHSVLAIARGIPVRGITLFIFGGVSQITREAERPGTEFAVAIVGPLSSMMLGLVFWGLHVAVNPTSQHLGLAALYLMRINFVLAVFNMVPGFPLDGGRVLRATIWKVTGDYARATTWATRVGQLIAWTMILGGVAYALAFGDLLQGIWLVLIGWFLNTAASTARNQFRLRRLLEGYKAKNVVARSCPSVPDSLTLDVFVGNYIMPTGCRVFVVTRFNEPMGIVTTGLVRAVPRGKWREERVGSIMHSLDGVPTVAAEDDAYRVLELMSEAGVTELPVVRDGEFIGLVSREEVLRLASTRSELEG